MFLASSLLACSTSSTQEEVELPDTLTDGAADSWSQPTKFGALFEATWQRGQLDPSRRIRFPAWDFSLTASADVTVTTRQAPTADPELTATVLYLYRQRDTGTWKRIAKSSAANAFASLTQSLGAGEYRVIAKGLAAADAGDFLLRRDCTGAGCANGPQCLVGDAFWKLRDVLEGAVIDYGSKNLTITSALSDALKAQIIAAVRESAHDDVTTLEGAFAAVDDNAINRYRLYDDLAGRSLVAIEYGAGGNSYGAFFVEDGATPVAAIHDGDIANCTITPQACVFGQHMGEAAFMPQMKQTSSKEHTSPAGIDAMTSTQILAAIATEEPMTLAEAFENVDEGTIYVNEYKHADGREFTEIHWYGGDNPVGTFFRAGTNTAVAQNGDGDLYGCTEY